MLAKAADARCTANPPVFTRLRERAFGVHGLAVVEAVPDSLWVLALLPQVVRHNVLRVAGRKDCGPNVASLKLPDGLNGGTACRVYVLPLHDTECFGSHRISEHAVIDSLASGVIESLVPNPKLRESFGITTEYRLDCSADTVIGDHVSVLLAVSRNPVRPRSLPGIALIVKGHGRALAHISLHF